jgi:lipopolysaccharide transport system ATP-binding protein
MDNQPVIRFQNVSKRFVFTSAKPQTFLESVISLFSRRSRRQQEHDLWAVHDVTFDVLPGHCLGIVGRNGSGKSTILKLIARILRPTSGQMFVRGRVSALLELGAGFHPDLTGRENIFLNASVLGLSKKEIEACFEEVVAFSELGEFIDMPVKHYSSGMYMRLGFSVAIHVKPDILIVDEILAVGDQAFQAKCIDRIYDMKRQGTTIIIVSHTLRTVRKLCSHLLWIEHGRLRRAGPVDDVAEAYEAYMEQPQNQHLGLANGGEPSEQPRSNDLKITTLRILDAAGHERATLATGDKVIIEIGYLARQPVHTPVFMLAISRQDGIKMSVTHTGLSDLVMETIQGSGVVRCTIERLPLLPASYRLATAVYGNHIDDALDAYAQGFQVIANGATPPQGLIELPALWEWAPEEQPICRT